MTELYEEMDHLRAREQEATALFKELKTVTAIERDRALSATEEVKKLQRKLKLDEDSNTERMAQLKSELEQVKGLLSAERHRAASKKNSLMAQLNYASEKIRLLQKNSQGGFSPVRSRPASKSSKKHSSPISIMNVSASTISGTSANVHDTDSDVGLQSLIQHKFHHLHDESSESSTEEEDEPTLSSASSLTTSKKRASFTSQMLGGQSGSSRLLATVPEDEELSEGRISELQRRNSKYLPHLKSSYAVELQTQKDSPSTSDEHIKNGSRHVKSNKPPKVMSTSHLPTKKPVAFEVPIQQDPLHSPVVVTKQRKRSREHDSVSRNRDALRSPTPKLLRRGNAPQTPPKVSRFTKEVRRTTGVAGGMKLRGYLDEPNMQGDDSTGRRNSGTVRRH